MNIANKRKQQLGMPFGTACGRLRKTLLFRLVQQANRDICFVCDKKITKASDLTIEHKIPWLDNDTHLFWDLDNIAFSHKQCNKPDIARRNRKIGPKGTSWCYICEQFLPNKLFGSRPGRWNGLDWECKHCKTKRVRQSEWYIKRHPH